jgi:hypothetical protein
MKFLNSLSRRDSSPSFQIGKREPSLHQNVGEVLMERPAMGWKQGFGFAENVRGGEKDFQGSTCPMK